MLYKHNSKTHKGFIARALPLAMLAGVALIFSLVLAACAAAGSSGGGGTPDLIAAGAACTENGTACVAGHTCDPTNFICVLTLDAPDPIADGEACTLSGVACATGLACEPNADGTGTICQVPSPVSTLVTPGTPVVSEDLTDGFINSAENNAGYTITVAPADANESFTVGHMIRLTNGNTPLTTPASQVVDATTTSGVTFTGTLDDGIYTLGARVDDGVSMRDTASSATLDFTVDTVAPAAPATLTATDASDGFINIAENDAGYAIVVAPASGSSFAVNDDIKLLSGNVSVDTATVDSGTTGGVTFNIATDGLDAGFRSITATVTDKAGNEGPASSALTFTVDLTAPAAPAAPTLMLASDDGDDTITAAELSGNAIGLRIVPVTGERFVADKDKAIFILRRSGDPDIMSEMTIDNAVGSTIASAFTRGQVTDGAYALTAIVENEAGNQSPESVATDIEVDLISATETSEITITSTDVVGGFVNQVAEDDGIQIVVTISGSLGAFGSGDSVELYIGSEMFAPAITATPTSGTSVTLTIPKDKLTEGVVGINAIVFDSGRGANFTADAALVFTLDRTVPATPTTPRSPQAASVGGTNYINEADNTAGYSVVVDGPFVVGDVVELLDGGSSLTPSAIMATVGTDAGATTSAVTFGFGGSDTVLPDGAYSFTATVTDAAGNPAAAPSAAFAFTVDAVAPVAPATPQAGELVDGIGTSTKYINIDANAGGYDITVAPASGSSFAEGDRVVLTNGAGLSAVPLIPERAATVASSTTGGVTIAIPPSGGLPDGVYTIGARVTDAAGNTPANSADTLDFTVDLTPATPAMPTASELVDRSGINYINIDANMGGYNIVVAAAGGIFVAGDTVTLTDGGSALTTPIPITVSGTSRSRVTFTIPASSGLSDGDYTIGAMVTDVAGNDATTSSTLDFTVDLTPPVVTPAAPTASRSGSLIVDLPADNYINRADATGGYNIVVTPSGGSFTVGDTIELTDEGNPFAPARTVLIGSTSSVTVAIPQNGLADKAYELGARVIDPAGNPGTISATLDFTVDLTTPGRPRTPVSTAAGDGYVNATERTSGYEIVVTVPGGVAISDTVTLTDSITGTATPLVLASPDQNPITITTAAPSVTFAIPAGTFADGNTPQIGAMISDPAGNRRASSTTLNFTVDTMAPAAPPAPTLANDTSPMDNTLTTAELSDDEIDVRIGTSGMPAFVTGERYFLSLRSSGGLDLLSVRDGYATPTEVIDDAFSTDQIPGNGDYMLVAAVGDAARESQYGGHH